MGGNVDALDFGREEIRSRLDNARFHPLDVHIDQINNPMGTQNFLQRNDIDNDTASSGAVLDERSSAIRFGSLAPRCRQFPNQMTGCTSCLGLAVRLSDGPKRYVFLGCRQPRHR